MKYKYLICILLISIAISCKDDTVYTPKPIMYPRIIYPERGYDEFKLEACNFIFDKPVYASIKTGLTYFGEDPKDPCWFDLEISSLNTSIHFSYNAIGKENTLDKLISDAFKLTGKHNSRADFIEEVLVKNSHGANGLLFKIDGPVASPINFFLTDSTTHFVRASLYFNSAVNPDSIAPVLSFVSTDIQRILESFEWIE